jgi:hypothetical protein
MTLPEDWASYFKESDDDPMSIFVNVGLSRITPIVNYSTLLCISINYTSKDNGFPIDEDLDKLSSIHENLIDAFQEKFKAIHAGSITSDGTRDFFIYFKKEVQVEKMLSKLLQGFSSHTYHFSKDKNWGLFWSVLMPSENQYQSIQNGRVLYDMESQGDLLQKAREVSHWAYFKSEKDQNSFQEAVENENFKVLNKSFDKENSLPFEIVFSRVDHVNYDEIDVYTINLYHIAKTLNGNYDGWECETFPDKN